MSGIVHWDRLVHKGVRSKDMEDMGNVIAIDDLIITTMQGVMNSKYRELV